MEARLINLPKLATSPVIFDENSHTYSLPDGTRLSGITNLIHQATGIGIYHDVSDYVRNVAIPRAGEYGHSVHHAILYSEDLGVTQTKFTGRFDTYDVSAELESYLRNRDTNGFVGIANEYTVSDCARYASQIDNIWLHKDTEAIWLVDTKTNNLTYYPGGEDALRVYLSYQLSCYAYLFELQNPSLKVSGLACNWLRGKDSKFWTIDRLPDDEIKELLSTPWILVDGNIEFLIADPVAAPSMATDSPQVDYPEDMARELADAMAQQDALSKRIDALKAILMERMSAASAKSYDCGLFKASYTAASTSSSFDSKKLKEDAPDIYAKYIRKSNRAASVRITLPQL